MGLIPKKMLQFDFIKMYSFIHSLLGLNIFNAIIVSGASNDNSVFRTTSSKTVFHESTVTDVAQFTQECPWAKQTLSDLCATEWSCRNKCGQAIHRNEKKYCSCDDSCPIYKDCCWDYTTQCTMNATLLQKFDVLGSLKTECLPFSRVLTSCPQGKEPMAEPIYRKLSIYATDKEHGIHFQSFGHLMCHTGQNGVKEEFASRWTVHYSSLGKPNTEDIKSFLENGTASELFMNCIQLNPPDGFPARMCLTAMRFKCTETVNAQLQCPSTLVSDDLAALCLSVQSLNNEASKEGTEKEACGFPAYLWNTDNSRKDFSFNAVVDFNGDSSSFLWQNENNEYLQWEKAVCQKTETSDECMVEYECFESEWKYEGGCMEPKQIGVIMELPEKYDTSVAQYMFNHVILNTLLGSEALNIQPIWNIIQKENQYAAISEIGTISAKQNSSRLPPTNLLVKTFPKVMSVEFWPRKLFLCVNFKQKNDDDMRNSADYDKCEDVMASLQQVPELQEQISAFCREKSSTTENNHLCYHNSSRTIGSCFRLMSVLILIAMLNVDLF